MLEMGGIGPGCGDVIEAHLQHLYNLYFHPGNTASIPDAWLHAAHRLPLHVDQQRGHLGHDGLCHLTIITMWISN